MAAPDIIACYDRGGDPEQLMYQHDPVLKFRNSFVDSLFSAA
jgi:hypothetical protein